MIALNQRSVCMFLSLMENLKSITVFNLRRFPNKLEFNEKQFKKYMLPYLRA